MERGCPGLEKWQMSVPLTENQSGVLFQMLTLSIPRCALGWGSGSRMEKTLNRSGSDRYCNVRHFLVMQMS